MADKRVFAGIGFGEALGRDFAPWMKKLRKTADQKEIALKWTPVENYHVTLFFLGETPEEEIPALAAKLETAAGSFPVFELKLRGLDALPGIEHARVLYLDVQRSQTLVELQAAVAAALAGGVRDGDDYVPHLTVARLRNPKGVRDLLSPFRHVDLGRQAVTEVVLYESIQTGPYSVYQPLHRVPLRRDA